MAAGDDVEGGHQEEDEAERDNLIGDDDDDEPAEEQSTYLQCPGGALLFRSYRFSSFRAWCQAWIG
jgi:hypothetical protein